MSAAVQLADSVLGPHLLLARVPRGRLTVMKKIGRPRIHHVIGVLLDPEDAYLLTQYSWIVKRRARDKTAYLNRRERRVGGGFRSVLMHREVMGAKPGEVIDHVNGNGFDNRKANLRRCNTSQNLCNRGPNRNSKSGLKGVYWDSARELWKAAIKKDRKIHHLGRFKTAAEAVAAYAAAAARLHGEFARP